jgi:hypothetical protein
MNKPDDSDDENCDSRLVLLMVELQNWKVGDELALDIHECLSTLGMELTNETVRTTLAKQAHKDQVTACGRLEKSAHSINAQLDFLGQFSSLENALAEAYEKVAINAQGSRELPPLWQDFRARLVADSARLLDVAAKVQADLSREGGVRGQPVNRWKKRHFNELFARLSKLSKESEEARAEVTAAVWNMVDSRTKCNTV